MAGLLFAGAPVLQPTVLSAPATSRDPATSQDPATCGRLRAEERSLVCANGSVFRWRGVTAFRLADAVADGREADSATYLDWARRTGFNVVRVLATLCCWFDLEPEAGHRALPRLLDLAQTRGLYVQIVALAGTGPGGRSMDLEAQVRFVGAIAAAHVNAVVEIANEPGHGTQDPRLHEFVFVDKLAALVPDEVLTIGGSGSSDYGITAPLGDLVTRHLARLDDTWEMMRRMRALDHVRRATGRPVLSGEPVGAGEVQRKGSRETDAALFFAYGALCRVFEISCNFHLEAGLHATIPGPVQQTAAEAFIAGTRVAPDEWRLVYHDLGSPDSPVSRAHLGRAAGVYSAISGDDGITVAFGLKGDPELQWRGFSPVGAPIDRGAVKVWKIKRGGESGDLVIW